MSTPKGVKRRTPADPSSTTHDVKEQKKDPTGDKRRKKTSSIAGEAEVDEDVNVDVYNCDDDDDEVDEKGGSDKSTAKEVNIVLLTPFKLRPDDDHFVLGTRLYYDCRHHPDNRFYSSAERDAHYAEFHSTFSLSSSSSSSSSSSRPRDVEEEDRWQYKAEHRCRVYDCPYAMFTTLEERNKHELTEHGLAETSIGMDGFSFFEQKIKLRSTDQFELLLSHYKTDDKSKKALTERWNELKVEGNKPSVVISKCRRCTEWFFEPLGTGHRNRHEYNGCILITKDRAKETQCTYCGSGTKFPTIIEREAHEQVCSKKKEPTRVVLPEGPPKPYQCILCGNSYPKKLTLQSHQSREKAQMEKSLERSAVELERVNTLRPRFDPNKPIDMSFVAVIQPAGAKPKRAVKKKKNEKTEKRVRTRSKTKKKKDGDKSLTSSSSTSSSSTSSSSSSSTSTSSSSSSTSSSSSSSTLASTSALVVSVSTPAVVESGSLGALDVVSASFSLSQQSVPSGLGSQDFPILSPLIVGAILSSSHRGDDEHSVASLDPRPSSTPRPSETDRKEDGLLHGSQPVTPFSCGLL